MDSRVTADEIATFRKASGDRYDDFPDDLLKRDFTFQWWLLSHRLNELMRPVMQRLNRLAARLGF